MASLELAVFGPGGHSAVSLRQLFELFPSLMHVAESNCGQVIGFSAGAVNRLSGAGWVLAVGSHSKHRRLGIGRALTVELIKQFEQYSVREIFLTVAPSNSGARSLYLQLGFIERENIENYFFDGSPRILMSRAAWNS